MVKRAEEANNARMAKRSEAKFSVEFDYNSIVKNEVDKVLQFKETVKLLEEDTVSLNFDFTRLGINAIFGTSSSFVF